MQQLWRGDQQSAEQEQEAYRKHAERNKKIMKQNSSIYTVETRSRQEHSKPGDKQEQGDSRNVQTGTRSKPKAYGGEQGPCSVMGFVPLGQCSVKRGLTHRVLPSRRGVLARVVFCGKVLPSRCGTGVLLWAFWNCNVLSSKCVRFVKVNALPGAV